MNIPTFYEQRLALSAAFVVKLVNGVILSLGLIDEFILETNSLCRGTLSQLTYHCNARTMKILTPWKSTNDYYRLFSFYDSVNRIKMLIIHSL